jgi:phosphatidate cytidylyltransferase
LRVRVASGIVGSILLFFVVWSGQIVLGLFILLVSTIALNEFYLAMENIGCKPIKFVGYLSALYMFLICSKDKLIKLGINVEFLINPRAVLIGAFLVLLILFCYVVFLHSKYNVSDIAATVFGVWYIVFLISFVILIRNMNNGFYYVWLIFIGAFATDTFAYFTGYFFGKHKLMPEISPKKTVEGSIGGIIGCAVVMGAYGIYLINNGSANGVALYHFVVLGLICGVISQIGDWSASAIKRYVNIKDFGNIMPGHGGALDRFDSILFTAPVVYFYLTGLFG